LLMVEKENFKEAFNSIQLAIKYDKTNNLDYVAYKAFILFLQEKKPEAKALAQSVLKKDPNNEMAKSLMEQMK
jgi:tetratricopeptide (TPR) repeat protein